MLRYRAPCSSTSFAGTSFQYPLHNSASPYLSGLAARQRVGVAHNRHKQPVKPQCTNQLPTCHGWQPASVSACPTIHSERRARVSATFMRRTSDRKPTPPPLPPLCALRGQERRRGAWRAVRARHRYWVPV